MTRHNAITEIYALFCKNEIIAMGENGTLQIHQNKGLAQGMREKLKKIKYVGNRKITIKKVIIIEV